MPQSLRLSGVTWLLILATNQCSALNSVLRTVYNASNFFEEFNFRDAAFYNAINPNYGGDPTNGSVNYLSKDMAMHLGLAKIENGKVFLGVDSKRITELRGSSPTIYGRDSVRLESKDPWSSGIMITDVEHMPGTACGVWPSIWSYNNEEDPVGEIDLIEGMNLQDSNIVSLHTCGTCSFSNIGGLDERANCNNGGSESQSCENGDNFDGCGSTMSTGSYGPEFNEGKGGVFATWLQPNALRIYWWNRDNVPSDILSGNPDPDTWGKPASQFISGSDCDVGNYFKKQTIVSKPRLAQLGYTHSNKKIYSQRSR
ncbi:hypothetical protein NLG97_g3159 [Lecanicillium saksenae]|uniref:Uncharacterized protein n=1 Tax=Lecanicillium saksenae TaxID=468837 RepID=A0ACC1QZG7_9HYPO|nr:hypothetical protein NLG97_g3159 [Lecanicillium saksenae]